MLTFIIHKHLWATQRYNAEKESRVASSYWNQSPNVPSQWWFHHSLAIPQVAPCPIRLSVEYAIVYNLKVCLNPGTLLLQHLHANGLVRRYKKARGPICPFIRSRCKGFHFLQGNYKRTRIPVECVYMCVCENLPGGNSHQSLGAPELIQHLVLNASVSGLHVWDWSSSRLIIWGTECLDLKSKWTWFF